MSKSNVADLIIQALHQVGVRRIYGVVGDSLNALTEALRQHGGSTGSIPATRKWQHSPLGPKRT